MLFAFTSVHLTNNHRIMLQNSKLRDCTIHNLSRFSSARGLQEELQFNIGYEVTESRVVKMFADAEANICKNREIAIDGKYPMEI